MELLILLIYIGVFLYSVILHEVAHGFVANLFGDDTAKFANRLSLNPLVHIDLVGSILVPLFLIMSNSSFLFGWAKPVPVNPFRLQGGKKACRLVSAAGILTNLSLALVAGLVLKIVTQIFSLPPTNLGVIFFTYTFFLNLVLAVFNAVPLPNFDGFNFLMTFDWFMAAIKKTPLANPVFMYQYGLFLSLLVLVLFFSFIGRIISYVVFWLANFFGVTGTILQVLDLLSNIL